MRKRIRVLKTERRELVKCEECLSKIYKKDIKRIGTNILCCKCWKRIKRERARLFSKNLLQPKEEPKKIISSLRHNRKLYLHHDESSYYKFKLSQSGLSQEEILKRKKKLEDTISQNHDPKKIVQISAIPINLKVGGKR